MAAPKRSTRYQGCAQPEDSHKGQPIVKILATTQPARRVAYVSALAQEVREMANQDAAPLGNADETDDEVVWWPTPDYRARSRLLRFLEHQGIADVDELRQRANADIGWFWDAVVRDLDLEFYEPYRQTVDLSRGAPWARWFCGGQYNYVHNALDRRASGIDADRIAIRWDAEDGARRSLTFAQLASETDRLARGLVNLGLGPGDRIGIFMPQIPEVVVAVLACGKIGAIFTPIFSGYAAPAVASRLQDCEARAVMIADGFLRRGKIVPMAATAADAVRQSPAVQHVIIQQRIGGALPDFGCQTTLWSDFPTVEGGFATRRTMADDPFMIIYTSGTTGRPKGAVHVQSGFPIKAAQDLAYCFDLQADDTLFWLTDIGWMMGPWVITGGLSLGATLSLYEGAIDFPQQDRLWQIVEEHQVTTLGISPTAVRALLPHGDNWVHKHDLSCLRVLGSTGEPWNPEPWRWLFEVVGGKRCPIINYSGGTEISGGIVGGLTVAPLKPCAFNGPVPGMDADVVDEAGKPLRAQVGELVIRQPWVGMTNGFWRDADRYLETYWSRWPGVWVHGDWAQIDADGSWYILGRSDDTIKIAGKRVGPAEVESAAVAHLAVAEAAAIGVPHAIKGEVLVVLVILRPGQIASETLRTDIRSTITAHLGRALQPEEVRFVADLPRTRNAKILRRIVRAAYLGSSDLGDLTSLENAAAIDAVRQAS